MNRKNWHESLEDVRNFVLNQEQSKKDNSVMEEIEDILREFTEDGKYELEIIVEENDENKLSKLTERNMLGRLSKSLDLNEENKQKLFDYFEKGVLEQ